MKLLVAVKRVVDFNVKVRVKADGSGVETANVKMVLRMTVADAKRLAFHPVGDRAAKAASGSDPHGARQASRLVGRPGGRRFAAINRSSSVADGPNFS